MPPTTEELTAALSKAETERDENKTALDKAAADLTKATTDLTALTEKVAELEKAAKPDDKPEPIDKSELPAAVVAMLEKAEADSKAAEQRIAKAEKDATDALAKADAEKDARLIREFIAKAEGMEGLHGDPTEVGPLLKAISEATPDAFTKFESDVLKPMAAQIAASDVFKEHGRGGDGQKTGALDEIQHNAAGLQKADSNLTGDQAFAKALDESDRALQQRYLDEVRG